MSLKVLFKGEEVELLDREMILFMKDNTEQEEDWVLKTFYPNSKRFADTNKVAFGELETTDLLAPFVTAQSKARQIGAGGSFESWDVHAAYVKPSRAITPTTVQDEYIVATLRRWGLLSENVLNGSTTNAEKLRISQLTAIEMNHNAINNRKRLMALDVLFKGYTEYQSEDYAYYKADFRRSVNMTIAVTTKWDNEAADVVADIDGGLKRMFDEAGVQPTILLSTSAVFNLAKKNKSFKETFTKADGSNQPNNTLNMPSFVRSKKPVYKGDIDGMQWWVYDDMHTLNGVKEHYVNPKNLYMIADTSGTQCQCQIEHLEVLGAPLDYFDYTDESRNPSALQQISESAPLMAPSMSNGVLTLQVLA